jgi:glycosyltransferase involved in cell wall biosynthesis
MLFGFGRVRALWSNIATMAEMLTTTVEIAAQKQGIMPDVVVILPTFQRPEHLRKTLASLAAQDFTGHVAVVIVENHATDRAGAAVAVDWLLAGHSGLVLIENRQGNCFAYNAGFLAADRFYREARFVAIIDDDECAGPGWLSGLITAAERHQADIVGGPQLPIFEDPVGAARFSRHPVFTPNHHASGPVDLVHSTGNVLIAMHVIRAMGQPVLDERFNYSGGGDTDFFTRCAGRGFRFAWNAEAPVLETVPARRSEKGWITARSLRNGMLSARIQYQHSPGFAGRLKVLAKSIGLLAASPFRAVGLAIRTRSAFAGSYHILVAIGRLLAEFGYRNEQYRQPEKN